MSSASLVRSTFVIGGAQALSVVTAIIRTKLLALMLGPTGVGLLSIYGSLQEVAAGAAGLGMTSSGVQKVAGTREDKEGLQQLRSVLLVAMFAQGLMAMGVLWMLRFQLADLLFSDPSRHLDVLVVGFTVTVSLVGAAWSTTLQGLRRVDDLARLTALGPVLGSLFGLAAIWAFGEIGLLVLVAALPIGQLLVAFYYIRKVPGSLLSWNISLADFASVWRQLAALGVPLMAAGLLTAMTMLIVRSYVLNILGVIEAGIFYAVWMITINYVGFILAAMAADYFPYLTQTMDDTRARVTLVNDQIQLGLAIAGPLLLVLIGWAPIVMQVLYSEEFQAGYAILQWQIVGNVLRISAWAMGFMLLASSRGTAYFIVQLVFNAGFVCFFAIGIDHMGIGAAGPAFLAACIIHFALQCGLARVMFEFRWNFVSISMQVSYFVFGLGIFALASFSSFAAAILSMAVGALSGVLGLRLILNKVGPERRFTALIARGFAILGWPIRGR